MSFIYDKETDTRRELTTDEHEEASALACNLARCGEVESIIAILANAYGEGVKKGYEMAGLTLSNRDAG